ncbi:MAG: hypothetical protein KA533_05335 [Sphingobium sp.]|nr:hypothetical protein [Sphingobium sp.]MBP6110796.1 hypothetical protein [Sphingobium sp.]MBP8671355.1 hypothetical protein [Sphingobium sp.]MBP9157484.1 hypothetical protein [Sphingobium sp.]
MVKKREMGLRSIRFSVFLLAALILGGCNARKPASVTIVPSESFQTMEAWEATARMWEFGKRSNRFDGSWMPARDRILTAMIQEGGINRLRLELRSGAENPVDYWTQFRNGALSYTDFKNRFYEKINDNADPKVLNPKGIQFSELDFRVENFILPAMRIAKSLGRPMNFSLCYVDFKWSERQGNLSHAAAPEEYAELIAAAYAHLKRKYGLEPATLEIVLEPDNTKDWGGRRIGSAIVAVSRRLEAQGIKPRIIAPSTSVARRAPTFFEEMKSIPGAADKVAVLSYHRYGIQPTRQAFNRINDSARSIRAQTAMLEFARADANILFQDLTQANVSSFQKYSIATPDLGRVATPPGNMLRVTNPGAANSEVETLPEATALASIFRVVEPGAVRVGTRIDQPWVQAVAFRNPDGRMILSVKADQGPLLKILEKVHRRLNTPMPEPQGGDWVRVRMGRAGQYMMQRSNTLVGRILRCTLAVDSDNGVARMLLRGGDVATLAEQPPSAPAGYPPCSADVIDWQ